MFLGLQHVILSAKFCPFESFVKGRTSAPGTAIPHVPGAPFWPDGKANEVNNPTEPRGVILCVIVTSTKDVIGIRQLFWKTLHEKGYHVRSSIAFRGNDVGHGFWHGIVCRNDAILGTCVFPGMGSKDPITDFQSDPRTIHFSFFVKQLQGAHLSIA